MSERVLVEELSPAVTNLALRVAAEVEAWRASGKLLLKNQKYTIRPNFSLQYSVSLSNMNFDSEEVYEESWDSENWQLFCSLHIDSLPEFDAVLRIVDQGSQSEDIVRNFATAVAYDYALTPKQASIEKHVSTIIRDLTGGVRLYRATIWLGGIRLAEDRLAVSETLSLRKPMPADLQEKVPDYQTHYAHVAHRRTSFSCIAELDVQTNETAEVQRCVDRIVSALRLFKLGSVFTSRYDVWTESFSAFARFGIGAPERRARLEYELAAPDLPGLASFLSTINPLIPSSYEYPPRKPDFLSTALQWYSEAVLSSGPIPGNVAWAVACLEALFLGDNPSSEILYRLAQRTALLLKCFGWSPLDVVRTMKTAYDVRSKYVHGAVTKKELAQSQLMELSRAVGEYARTACLIWLQLRTLDRKTVLDTLEAALVDDTARKQLEYWCSQVEFATRK